MEQGMARRLPWVTIFFAVANLAVFAWELAAGADAMQPTAQWMLEHGGTFGPVTLAGEEWRLVTSMFLHYGVLHIVMNMIGLLDGGRHVERMYGPAGFATIYMVSGLAAALATSLRASAVSAGASGAIFGVFGAFGAYLLLHRGRLDRHQVTQQSRGLMIFLAYNIWFGFTAESIDMVAHIGGLIAGFIIGLALEAGTDEGHTSGRRSFLVAVVGLALVAGGAFLAPSPTNAFAQFGTSEQKVLDRWNGLITEAKAGKITDAALADVIDSELLPAWRDLGAAYAKDGEGKLHRLTLDYIRARQEGWEIVARGLRAGDEAEVNRGMTRFNQGDAIIEKMRAASK
jgi:rhomboid protease GluP